MAETNSLNPTFLGKVTALGFDAIHGGGVSVTCVACTGTTAVNVFGATNGFKGTITGILVNTLGATAASITVADTAGTVATITTGSTAGTVVGSASALANTAFTAAGTLTVVSNAAADTSKVWIAYKCTETAG